MGHPLAQAIQVHSPHTTQQIAGLDLMAPNELGQRRGEAKQLISWAGTGASRELAQMSRWLPINDKANQVNEFINIYLSSFLFEVLKA